MIWFSSISSPLFAFIREAIQKTLLFKSFTGLTVKQFDNFQKEITKRYTKYEIRRLSKRKNRERETGATGRPFKLDLIDRFLMLLVYYRLYITYT